MNPRLAHISVSLIREIAAKRKPSSIDLGLGEPSLTPNPAHLQAGMEYALKHGLRYTANAGDHQLREAIAKHYAYPDMDRAANVCVTTGSQEATYAVIKTVLNPQVDELLVVEPAFPSYAKMASLEGITVRNVAMREPEDFAFDPEVILRGLTPATRMIVICSPCNPSARVITKDAASAISRSLLRRGGEPVWILHDEIYREQTYIDSAGYFAKEYPYTIVTNSVSKSNALTGLRLGWAIAPHSVISTLVKVHAWLTSCTDAFAQQVALHIFQTNALGEHASWYAAHRNGVVAALEESGLRYIAPEGSFYACVRLPDAADSLSVAHALADEHEVIAVPGVAFGECFEKWLRLTWVSELAAVREGLRRIAGYSARAFCGATE